MSEQAIKQRAAVMWSRIGHRVAAARNSQEALRALTEEFGFAEADGQVVLAMRVADLVSFANAADTSAETVDPDKVAWESQGAGFTRGEWLPEERESWRQWIRDGVENQWLSVVRLRDPATLIGLERTNDDRSIYISHDIPDGSSVRVHTAIGGSYSIEDEHLAMELAECLDPGSDEVLATAVDEGAFGLCEIRFNGVELTGRSLSSQGWWAVGFAVGPTTSAFCTGRGDVIPSLDTLEVRSFDDLSEPVDI